MTERLTVHLGPGPRQGCCAPEGVKRTGCRIVRPCNGGTAVHLHVSVGNCMNR